VDGEEISAKTRLLPDSTIQIGYTTIRVHIEVQPSTAPIDAGEDETVISNELDASQISAQETAWLEDALEETTEKSYGENDLSDVTFQHPLSDYDEATVINPVRSSPSEPQMADPAEATVINPDVTDAASDTDTVVSVDTRMGSATDTGPAEGGGIIDITDMSIHARIGSGHDVLDEILIEGWQHLNAFNNLVETLVSTSGEVDALVRVLARQLQKIVPNAVRGALLLPGGDGELLLKACWPAREHTVGTTWVHHAFLNRKTLIWAASAGDGVCRPNQPRNAVYLPLMVSEDPLGIMYVDNYRHREMFSATDLELLKAVAHQVAVWVKDRTLK
jgi:hypothetical protein